MLTQHHFRLKTTGLRLQAVSILLPLVFLAGDPPPVRAQDASKQIDWHGYKFSVTEEIPPDVAAMHVGPVQLNRIETFPESVEGYYFVQLDGPVTREKKQQLVNLGAKLGPYVPENAYLLKMTRAVKEKVEKLPWVRGSRIFQPAMRVSQPVRELVIKDRAQQVTPPPSSPRPAVKKSEERPLDTLYLRVQTFGTENRAAMSDQLKKAGATLLGLPHGDERIGTEFKITVKPEDLDDIARINGVMWIEPFSVPAKKNDRARGTVHIIRGPNPGPRGLLGDGQILAIADTGLDTGTDGPGMHPDFRGRIRQISSLPVNAPNALNNGADDGAADLDSGHGTHVAGSAVGGGSVSGGQYQGVAPNARIVFQAIEQYTQYPPNLSPSLRTGYILTGIPDDLKDLFDPAYAAGARVHTNSWGLSDPKTQGTYDAQCNQVDLFVWDHPDLLVLFAAGNDGQDDNRDGIIDLGSVTPPGTAKNCLTVGASENNRPELDVTYAYLGFGPPFNGNPMADNPDEVAAFSSRGPTKAGRIKPDIVAPGTVICSARTQVAPNRVWLSDDAEAPGNTFSGDAPWCRISTTSHSGSSCWHDNTTGQYAPGVNISLTSPRIDLSGGSLSDKTLQFWCRYDLGSGDQWFFEVSSDDGMTWGGIPAISGKQAGWKMRTISLGTYSKAQQFRVRFRLQSDSDTSVGDGLYIDDIRILEGAFGSGLLSDLDIENPGTTLDRSYLFDNGTSMATPLVAGAALQVRQFLIEDLKVPSSSAALIRATLTNGARIATNPIPNPDSGWGRINCVASIAHETGARFSFFDVAPGLETNDCKKCKLVVTHPEIPLSITMVYHDWPGESIVNDLDLKLTSPDGTSFFPNGRTTPDPLNNVERIVISSPLKGDYTVEVFGRNVPQGPQRYALVATAGGAMTN